MIRIRQLTCILKGRTVIDDLDLDLEPGGRLCLAAGSGAGKTTLIRILSGLHRDFDGEVQVCARHRTTIFQDPGLFWYMTLAGNILLPLRLLGIPQTPDLLDRYRHWLEVTGLGGYDTLYPFESSGGMKQKTAIIRAFITDPDLVLMDEPFKSVDPESRNRIMAHIGARYPETGLVLTGHHPEDRDLIQGKAIRFTGQRISGRNVYHFNPKETPHVQQPLHLPD